MLRLYHVKTAACRLLLPNSMWRRQVMASHREAQTRANSLSPPSAALSQLASAASAAAASSSARPTSCCPGAAPNAACSLASACASASRCCCCCWCCCCWCCWLATASSRDTCPCAEPSRVSTEARASVQRRKSCESVRLGFRVGDGSRGRFATPADFPRRDCSAY
jgi:hypothetical protein